MFWRSACVLFSESSFMLLMLFCLNSAYFLEIQLYVTDGPTDGLTAGRTHHLVEMRECGKEKTKKQKKKKTKKKKCKKKPK